MRKKGWIRKFAFLGLLAFGGMDWAQAANLPLNDYTLNFSSASGGALPNLRHVDEKTFLASSILGFRDLDGSGNISKGDKFRDYTMLRFETFVDVNGNNITPSGYGTGATSTHGITVKTVFSGVQTSGTTYAVTSVDLLQFYFDSGATYTPPVFTDLRTFQNGVLVETGTGPAGPSGGNNAGPTAPDGTIDVIVQLLDNLHNITGQYFELDDAGNPLELLPGIAAVLGDFDANNDATPPQSPLGGLNGTERAGLNPLGGFADVFGAFGLGGTQLSTGVITSLLDSDGAFSFGFQTRSDGSFNKEAVVPEPGTLALLGTGLAAVGLWGRSRRKK